MSGLVYQAINAVAADIAQTGIAKSHHHADGDYQYRSIDDVLAALAPLLARHKLCVLPRILERSSTPWGQAGQLVTVRAAFDLASAIDGSVHSLESFGEAIDDSDKGTAKAISSAYKSAMLQAFCIPVPQEDADSRSPRLKQGSLNSVGLPEPPQGWESWTSEVIDIVRTCETADAIDRLCSARRLLLASLQRSRAELYGRIGATIAARLEQLARPREDRGSQSTEADCKASRRKRPKEKHDASRQPAEAA